MRISRICLDFLPFDSGTPNIDSYFKGPRLRPAFNSCLVYRSFNCPQVYLAPSATRLSPDIRLRRRIRREAPPLSQRIIHCSFAPMNSFGDDPSSPPRVPPVPADDLCDYRSPATHLGLPRTHSSRVRTAIKLHRGFILSCFRYSSLARSTPVARSWRIRIVVLSPDVKVAARKSTTSFIFKYRYRSYVSRLEKL